MTTAEDIRLGLARQIGRDPSPSKWRFLVENGYVDERVYSGADPDMSELANVYGNLGGRRRRLQHSNIDPDEQNLVLSEIVALLASRAVQPFRSRVLSALLRHDEVEQWVRDHAAKDGDPTDWVRVPIDAEGNPLAPIVPTEKVDAAIRPVYRETLIWQTPDHHFGAQEVTYGGVLHDLLIYARFLNELYGWSEPQAATFILTGHIPDIPMIHAYVKSSPMSSGLYRHLERIVMEINPRNAPRRVAGYYSELRSQVLAGDPQQGSSPRRERKMTAKHLALAKVAAGREIEERPTTWRELMDEWNAEHSEWQYKKESQFNRDALAAFRRVMGIR